MSGQIVKTFNITQTSEGDEEGNWTTVISAAILLP
jgi:arginine decarboxylase